MLQSVTIHDRSDSSPLIRRVGRLVEMTRKGEYKVGRLETGSRPCGLMLGTQLRVVGSKRRPKFLLNPPAMHFRDLCVHGQPNLLYRTRNRHGSQQRAPCFVRAPSHICVRVDHKNAPRMLVSLELLRSCDEETLELCCECGAHLTMIQFRRSNVELHDQSCRRFRKIAIQRCVFTKRPLPIRPSCS